MGKNPVVQSYAYLLAHAPEFVRYGSKPRREIGGDPSFAGPLPGVPLELQGYHILEPEIKQIIPEAVYQEMLGIFEMTSDGKALGEALSKIRKNLEKAHGRDDCFVVRGADL